MRLPDREIFRASRLDEFRLYLSGETFTGEEYTAEAFAARLTSREETAKMAAGTAVHKALELASVGEMAAGEQNGWSIAFELDAELDLPTLREIPLCRRHNGIPLFGRVDSITGTTVRDIKTTAQIDPDRYAESYQWRAYLWMSGRDVFLYDLLKAKVDEAAMSVTITDYVRLGFHRYPGLDGDVERLLERYAEVVHGLGILERSEAAA